VFGMAAEDNAVVRSSGCRAVGVYVLFPILRDVWTLSYVMLLSEV